MDFAEILNFIHNSPGWAWFVIGFVLLILMGDKKLWEFEVKFPMKQGVGRGEIEFEGLKKKGTHIEIKFNLDASQANQQIDIYLKERHVFTIPADQNQADSRININKKIKLEQPPNEADTVTVKIGGQQVFDGQLFPD